jgi:hypothetical protein
MPIFTVGAAGTTSSGFEISNSLRFNRGSSDYLTRSPPGAGNRKTFTWSGWVKRVTLGSSYFEALFAVDPNPRQYIAFYQDKLYTYGTGGGDFVEASTTALFRDTNAWYHVVYVWDTTQATGSNRVKIYVNGVQQTLSFATTPSLNYDGGFNTTQAHTIGGENSSNPQLSGYMAEVYFIDGQALDPTSFGEFDSNSGIWKPIEVSGLTFGTNGYYLDFKNNGTKHTLTANGDVKHSTAQNKIGATSIAFDGTNDWITVTDNAAFDFGTDPFTIEMWVRMDSSSTDYTGLFTMDNPQCSFRINAQGRIQFLQDHGGTRGNTDDADTSGTNLRDNAWHHVAVVRESDNSWDLYVDGTSEYSGTGMTGNITGHSDIVIGRRADSDSYYLNGYLDEIRVSKAARYTSNFTPSTTAFTSDDKTILLIHSDTTNNSTTFTDSSGVVNGLGNDQSGGEHHYTTNNLTLVDQSLDTPTNIYNTLNTLSNPPSGYTLSEGNLESTVTGSSFVRTYIANTIAPESGKWYWESKLKTSGGSDRTSVGICSYEETVGTGTTIPQNELSISTGYSRIRFTENGSTTEVDSFYTVPSENDIFMYALDLDNTKYYFGINGVWWNYNTAQTGGDPTSGSGYVTNSTNIIKGAMSFFSRVQAGAVSTTFTNQFNFGSPPYAISSSNSDANGHGNFEYAVPTGFYALNSKNLAEFG